jgi:type IV pilus assembly protein PilQ
VRQAQIIGGMVIGGAVALLATQPSLATVTQVTAVKLNQSEGELQLTLQTHSGNERPQVYTVSRGNDIVADIVNTQLTLNEGESFRQEKPMPGIAEVSVSQLAPNKVRVVVSGETQAPTGQVLQQDTQEISLNFSMADGDDRSAHSDPETPVATSDPSTPSAPTPSVQTPQSAEATPTEQTPKLVAQVPSVPATSTAQTPSIPQTVPPPAPGSTTTPDGQPPTPAPSVAPPRPDVLVPNPTITIEGVPAQPAGAVQPVAPAPPFLPRAIAPPVGDIAISNINAAPTIIDMGTAVRVPRLVLREAPVREVLALLARSAGLNVAFIGGEGAAAAAPGAAPGAAPSAGGAQQTISLDLENESVQDVFNYVLQITGLQANRVGRTILVGSQLPEAARNIISRTLRLNQVNASDAAAFLVAQGAEQQQIQTQRTLTVVGEGAAAQRIENTTTQVQRLSAQTEGQGQGAQGAIAPLLLRGLSVSADQRLNAVTLIGEPRRIEIASALLTQLDLRRRQVAVNVKIVDVNLLGTDAVNSSFSFGIGDGFFVVDQGAAVFNYGGIRPPTAAQTTGSTITPPVIANPFANATVFQDPNTPLTLPGLGSRIVTVNRPGGPGVEIQQAGAATVVGGAPLVTLDNPLTPGIVGVTAGSDTIVTFNPDGTVTATAGQPGTVQFGLPSLFQYPKRLLAALQAQITSGNAKILTDPTLVVQEGQVATVNLTQEVFGGFRSSVQTDPTTNLTTQVNEPIIKNAGLILQINVQRIDDNGFVTLTVNPTVSAIGGSQNTPQGQITLIQQRQLESGQIRLRDGQTLILSGIIQESDRTTVSKVPFLGDIPLLGALFRSTTRNNSRQEVIVLLTPQIIEDAMGSSFGYNYTPGRDARQILERQGFPTQGRN